jgi:hypothetical protein
MTPEQLYSIVAYLCTQGEDSDCDNENNTEAIPAAIESLFGVRVDTTFGIVADAEPVATDEMATDADAEEAPAEESGD